MRCHAVDSSFKNQFLHTVRKIRLRADIIFLAPQDFYFNEKNTKKLLEKRTTSSKFWGLGSPTTPIKAKCKDKIVSNPQPRLFKPFYFLHRLYKDI